jgi:hypothetical protein
MRYAVDGYAVLGYFLQNETQVESAAIGVSTGSATAYATLNLQGDSLAASTSIGNVYSTLDDLQSNSFATSIGSGAIYSTLGLSGSGGQYIRMYPHMTNFVFWFQTVSLIEPDLEQSQQGVYIRPQH